MSRDIGCVQRDWVTVHGKGDGIRSQVDVSFRLVPSIRFKVRVFIRICLGTESRCKVAKLCKGERI